MAGTIRKQLTQTGQTDGTAGTTGNTGFSSLTTGAGNTIVHGDDAKMGQPAGIRLTQGGANTNLAYLDDTAARTVYVMNVPFSAPTPTANCAVLRFYDTAAHNDTTQLGGLLFTTTRRLQFVENGSGTPLNVTTPSGTPYTADADYLLQIKIDVTANTFDARVYPWGNVTQLASLTGTLGANMAAASGVQAVRWSIGTASAMSYLDTNSGFSTGDGDWLDRPDVSNTAPTVSLGAAVTNLEPGQTRTVTMTATDTDGTISSRTLTQTAGPTVTFTPAGTGVWTYEAPATVDGTTVTYYGTATDDDAASTNSASISDTVLPHDNWSWDAAGAQVAVYLLPVV